MVIDYQKLNEIAISNEFPLPKQEDILQALKGSQWLSTLDTLAGFTQVEVEPKERDKLAFWMHQGLWQFIRMPFDYKNSPSIFQCIVQNDLQCKTHLSSTSKIRISFLLLHMQSLLHSCLK